MFSPKSFFHETMHWVARVLAAFLLIVSAGVLYGNGLPSAGKATNTELALFLAFFAMLLGAAIGWRFERPGGILLLIAFTFFWVVNAMATQHFSISIAFALFGVAGVLYLLSWWSGPHPVHHPRKAH